MLLYRQLLPGVACACLLLAALPALAGSLIWEDEFVDEQSISGASIVSQDVQVDISTVVFSDNDSGGLDLTVFGSEVDFFTFENTAQGTHTGYGFLGFDNSSNDPADYIEITFSFASAVENVTFSLLDVDQRAQGGATDFDDAVIITYNGTVDTGGVNINTNPSNYVLHPNVILGDEGFGEFEGEPVPGTNDGTSGNADANLDVTLGAAAVNSLTVRYFSTDDTQADPSQQLIGISDLSWTVVIPVPEPRTALLVALGLIPMAARRRRALAD